MDLEFPGQLKLGNLNWINVVLGRNGCGKSSLLKQIDAAITGRDGPVASKYITPERGGVLRYDPGVDSNITSSSSWLQNTRRNNRFDQFRQQTMVLYRRLELLVLREIDADRAKKERFADIISSINQLLENIKIEQRDADFKIVAANGGNDIGPEHISSGEAELIGLAIECLTYARECKQRPNPGYLLLDEPDVHLHPDLQARFAELVLKLCKEEKMRVVLATHSTALAAALSAGNVHYCFMQKGQSTLRFRPASECMQRIVPVFGAHPLSAIFNSSHLLLVEGDDDARIWHRALRVSQGRLKLYPVETGGDGELDKYETETAEIVSSIYDAPVVFSIRDGDDAPDVALTAIGPVQRYKLKCRAAENLLLTDDVLGLIECPWPELTQRIDAWIEAHPQHVHAKYMRAFKDDGFQRRTHDLKEIRNDLLGIIGTNKSWEDAIGIALGRMLPSNAPAEHALQTYLGTDICTNVLKLETGPKGIRTGSH